MDDMTAFERQLTTGFRNLMGASEMVDDAAIFAAITAARTPKRRVQSLFGAARLFVAAATVALFGGFLVAGLLSTPSEELVPAGSPSRATTPDALPAGDLVTEELEPGVDRVLSDGLRTLSPAPRHELAIGADGSIWIATPSGRREGAGAGATLVRLGDAAMYPSFETGGWNPGNLGLQVAPDGSPWVRTGGAIARLGEKGWVTVREGSVEGYDIAPDGTAWMAWDASVGRLTPSGWAEHPIAVDLASALAVDPDVVGRRQVKGFRAAPDGSVWVGLAVHYRDPSPNEDGFGHLLLRFDGETWSAIDPMGIRSYFDMATFDIGADGTVWAYLDTGDETDPRLARLSEGEWSVYTSDDGVRIVGDRGNVRGVLAVAPDGTAWMRDGYYGCDGVRSFDGSVWLHYLDGICVADLDIAPDGTVWVTEALGEGYSLNASADDIYRIDPTVAGSGTLHKDHRVDV
jgi:hypothetical protein